MPRLLWRITIEITVAVLVLGIFFVYQQRAYASALTQQELRTYARVASIEYGLFVEQSRHVLTVLADLPQVKENNATGCSTMLTALFGTSTRYTNVGVVTVDGTLWCSAHRFDGILNISDRSYFKRAMEAGDFAVGDYLIGRITHKPAISFALPIKDSSGVTQKIIIASVNLVWLEDFVRLSHLPAGSTATIVDNEGTTLARYPDTEKSSGLPAPEVGYAFDRLSYLEQGLGQIEAHDATGQSYYVIAVPLHHDNQEGFLHLIISIPKNKVGVE